MTTASGYASGSASGTHRLCIGVRIKRSPFLSKWVRGVLAHAHITCDAPPSSLPFALHFSLPLPSHTQTPSGNRDLPGPGSAAFRGARARARPHAEIRRDRLRPVRTLRVRKPRISESPHSFKTVIRFIYTSIYVIDLGGGFIGGNKQPVHVLSTY